VIDNQYIDKRLYSGVFAFAILAIRGDWEPEGVAAPPPKEAPNGLTDVAEETVDERMQRIETLAEAIMTQRES
jgi:hypothetical protein